MQPKIVAGPFQLFVLQQTSSTILGFTFFLERAPVLLRIYLASGEPFFFFLKELFITIIGWVIINV